MTSTILHLFEFQLQYLKNLIDNIPEDRIYEGQLDGMNSPGWILGHFCVEAEDPLDYCNITYDALDEQWAKWFRNTTGKVTSLADLPEKSELIEVLDYRYRLLADTYKNLTVEQRKSEHPSTMLKDVLPDLDSWFAHHFTTHISIHCGNIVMWKKLRRMEIGGY